MKTFLLTSMIIAPLSLHAAPPQSVAASHPLGGSAVPGICLLSRPAVLEHSKVGLAATLRLQQLAEQAKTEVQADRQPVEAGRKAYQADAPKLTPDQRRTREQALAQQIQALQQKVALIDRELEATRSTAQARIAVEMQPVVQQAYQARNCGLLIDRASVLGGNLANDLTPAIVQGLDARITTISFEREILPPLQQPAMRP